MVSPVKTRRRDDRSRFVIGISIWLVMVVWMVLPLTALAADTPSPVRQAIADWKEAWQEKHFNRYAAFYSPLFFASGQDRRAWREKKSALFAMPGAVSITISGISIMAEAGRATATFIQHYSGPMLIDTGRKTLVWQLEDGRWRIIQEKWEPVSEDTGTTSAPTPPEANASPPPDPVRQYRQDTVSQLQPFALAMVTGDRSEHMCIRLDRHFVPRVSTAGPDSDRIQVTINDVPQWKGPDQVFDGRWIRQIAANFNAVRRTLQITVDLEPDSDCRISPVYIETANIFCLDLIEK